VLVCVTAVQGSIVCVEKGGCSRCGEDGCRSMQVRRRVIGKEHEDTLRSMAMVGLAKDIARPRSYCGGYFTHRKITAKENLAQAFQQSSLQII
jgi:hypothetical protein